jgi:hypothetical protein
MYWQPFKIIFKPFIFLQKSKYKRYFSAKGASSALSGILLAQPLGEFPLASGRRDR